MPTPDGYLSDDERMDYRPEPCTTCGGPVTVGWINHRKLSDTEDWWSPGRRTCLTDGSHQP